MPRTCIISLDSAGTIYSMSRKHDLPKLEGETDDMREERTWRAKCTVTPNGNVAIPGMGLKMAIDEAAKRYLGKIQGKGNATWGKVFTSGFLIEGDVDLGITPDEVERIDVQVNPQGIRGGQGRIRRIFPFVKNWQGEAKFLVLDDQIPNAIFEKAVSTAGMFIGVGRFRPERGGFNGRFRATSFRWETLSI